MILEKKDVQRATRKYNNELERNAKMGKTLEKEKKLKVVERQKVSALLQVDYLTRFSGCAS